MFSRFHGRAAIFLLVGLASAAEAAVYTLSQRGILALDIMNTSPGNVSFTKTADAEGVVFEISTATNTALTANADSIPGSGRQELVGFPVQPNDQLRLRFTLLSGPPNASVIATTKVSDSAGGLITNTFTLGGPGGVTSGNSTVIFNNTTTRLVGLTFLVTPQMAAAWPPGGGTMRIRVSPVPGTTILGPSGNEALRFIPITPCRVVDTRFASTSLGQPATPIPAAGTRTFRIPSTTACVIPDTARAYSMNVAVVPSGTLGYLTVWPSRYARPDVSTINSWEGSIKSSAAIIPAGSEGAVDVYASDPTHVVMDVNGYFVPTTNTSALEFYPVTPCRVVDTRPNVGPFAGQTIPANGTRTFAIRNTPPCNIPTAAQAYSLNLTVVPRGPQLNWITVYPADRPKPDVSTLNAPDVVFAAANAAIVPAAANGAINIFATDETDVVVDINGYFAAPSAAGLNFYAPEPCRVLDTRQPGSPLGAFSGTRAVNVVGSGCGIPTTARALALGATVLPTTHEMRWLTLWEQGVAQPTASTLNAYGTPANPASVTSNLAIVPTNNGSINAFLTETANLILDSFGYFAP